MIEILVQRNIAGHRRGDVVSVDPSDPRYAGHLSAGNVVVLDPAVDEVADEVLADAPTGTPWIHPDEDYDDAPLYDDGDDDEDSED